MMAAVESRQRILDAAHREFADHGFSGARMDTIAKAANVNKALPFYYFNSKEKLYEEVVTRVLKEYMELIRPLFNPGLTPDTLLETLPRVVIEFFSRHKDFLRIVGRELLNASGRAPRILGNVMRSAPGGGPLFFGRMVEQWYRDGLTREPDPVQFMLNLFSLSLFSILARPMVEAVFQREGEPDEVFYEKRIRGVIAVLKGGLLK